MNLLKNKNILITGGCGFIGLNIVHELLRQDAQVTVLDLPSANWDNLPNKVKRVKADILNKKTLLGAMKGIDVIYHLAARTDIDGKRLVDYEVNFVGTKNLIEEATKNKNIKQFVFYSTQLVVGIFNEKRFIDESEPYKTKTFYGESKIKGEEVVKKYCDIAKMPYTIIRPTSVYGPWGEAPYKQFFESIKNRRYFHIGKADNLVSMLYVKNLVNLTLTLTLNKKAFNEIFFANDFNPYTMKEFADVAGLYYKNKIRTIPNLIIVPAAYGLGVVKLLGINVPLYPFRLKNIKASYYYNIVKSIDAGYKPKYDLQNGIKETLDWYEKNYFEK